MNPVTGSRCTSVDIDANANLDLVDKFCYLGDILSVVRDADAAVETRIQIGSDKVGTIYSEREIVQQLCAKLYIAWK